MAETIEPRKTIYVELGFEIEVPAEDIDFYAPKDETQESSDRDLAIWEYLDSWCRSPDSDKDLRQYVSYMSLEVFVQDRGE